MAAALPADVVDVPALVRRCVAPHVDAGTMLRIIGTESNKRTYAIGYKVYKGRSIFQLTEQPRNKEEAITWGKWMYANGYAFDAGIAQIHSTEFARFGATAETIFEPCTNINIGSRILSDFYQVSSRKYGEGQRALVAAISAYNSGNFRTGVMNGYVQKVSNTDPYTGVRYGPVPLTRKGRR